MDTIEERLHELQEKAIHTPWVPLFEQLIGVVLDMRQSAMSATAETDERFKQVNERIDFAVGLASRAESEAIVARKRADLATQQGNKLERAMQSVREGIDDAVGDVETRLGDVEEVVRSQILEASDQDNWRTLTAYGIQRVAHDLDLLTGRVDAISEQLSQVHVLAMEARTHAHNAQYQQEEDRDEFLTRLHDLEEEIKEQIGDIHALLEAHARVMRNDGVSINNLADQLEEIRNLYQGMSATIRNQGDSASINAQVLYAKTRELEKYQADLHGMFMAHTATIYERLSDLEAGDPLHHAETYDALVRACLKLHPHPKMEAMVVPDHVIVDEDAYSAMVSILAELTGKLPNSHGA